MGRFLPVFSMLGVILASFGLSLLVPLGVAWAYDDAAFWSYPLPMLLALLAGVRARDPDALACFPGVYSAAARP